MRLGMKLAQHECRKTIGWLALISFALVLSLSIVRCMMLQQEAKKLEHLNNMARLALEQNKAKLALKALGQETAFMEGNKFIFARAQWLRFQAYRALNDVHLAQRYGVDALGLASPTLAYRWQLEFGLWRLETGFDLDEARNLLLEGVLGSPVYGSLEEHVLRVLLNLPGPNEADFEKIAAVMSSGKLVVEEDFSLSDDIIGSLYGILQNTSAMLHHFGMTCQCATEGGKRTWRAFGLEVAEAYEKPSMDPWSLPEIAPNTSPPIFLSKPYIPLEAVRQLEYFFFSSPTFWPLDQRSLSVPYALFRGHLRVLAAPATSLVDSMIAAMHLQLPASLRTRATHAEWWSHARPHRTYNGERQFFQGHACHTDNYDHEEGVALATSVLYLSDNSAATLVVNQSTKSMEVDPVAWVVHPKQSFMVTFDAHLWHCVLPPKGPELGSRRVSLNVLWLSQACANEQYEAKHCQHRPSIGWPWEAEIEATPWPEDSNTRPSLWSPYSVRAFSGSIATRLPQPLAEEL